MPRDHRKPGVRRGQFDGGVDPSAKSQGCEVLT
jgi:hypothetical protein